MVVGVRGGDRYSTVRHAVEKLLELEALRSHADVATLKVNFVDVRYPLACTHPDAVKAVVDVLRMVGFSGFVIAEESSVGDATEAFRSFGYFDAFRGYSDVELVDIGRLSGDDNPDIPVKIFRWDRGSMVIKTHGYLVNAPFLVSIGPPKTHDTVIVTLSVKNVAMALPKGREKAKVHQGYGIININIAVLAHLRMADMAVIDGSVGMEGDGPVYGVAKPWGWVFASHDSVALDSIVSYLMGFHPYEVGYLYTLHKVWGYTINPELIKTVGFTFSGARTEFAPHREYPIMRRWLDSAYTELLNRLVSEKPAE